MHDTVTNNSRLVAPFTGIYLITINVEWAANATGDRILNIRLNGGANIASLRQAATTSSTFGQHLSTLVKLDASTNDYVEAVVWQNTGASVNVNSTGSASPIFTMLFLGEA